MFNKADEATDLIKGCSMGEIKCSQKVLLLL
jgi:hypothetical protein